MTLTKAEIDAKTPIRNERRRLYKQNNLTVEGKLLTRKRPIAITDDILKQFDNLIKNTTLSLKAIGEKLGWKPTKKGQGGNLKPDSLLVKEYEKKYGTISDSRFKPHTLTLDSPQVKEVLKLQAEGLSTRRIAKQLNYKDEKAVRNIFKQFRPDAIKKPNVPGEITSAKQSKKNALENIKIANKKAGVKTTNQADSVINKILSKNEIYQNMPVEEIAKDKNFLKRLRFGLDPVTGEINYTGYTEERPVRGKVFTDLELAQHAKDKSMKYELIAPDHITPKAWRKQNVGYPITFQ